LAVNRKQADYSDFLLLLDPLDEYPSAYQPPPFNSKEHWDMIFLALLLHLEHRVLLVPILTSSSVT
jgi:hypothetical protein